MKVLANKLGPMLEKTHGQLPNGIYQEKKHLGCIVLTEEVIHQTKERKVGYILKIDFEKAYDVINRECLMETVKKRGFGPK